MSDIDNAFSKLDEFNDEDQIRDYVCNLSKDEIASLLLQIKKKRALHWEDRIILQMVEKSPLTFWASDKDYNVVFWSETCKDVYHRELLGLPFYEMISIFERPQAMKDSISVIEADENKLGPLLADFKNYYTSDLEGQSMTFNLVTNSMQLVNDETGEKYYGEIGLPIDLTKAIAEHDLRQKRFDKEVGDFNESVQQLQNKFDSGKKELLSKICSGNHKLNGELKTELRKRITETSSIIQANLDKYKSASNFDKFINDNDIAIDAALEDLEAAFNNALQNQILPDKSGTECEDPQQLKTDIDHTLELISSISTFIISKKSNVPIHDKSINDQRNAKITEFQSRRDKIVRDLNLMKIDIDQTTDSQLKLYRSFLNRINDDISDIRDSYN